MEQLTLILLVLPAMFVSSIIALAYIFKRLDHVQIPMFFKRCIIFLLYLIYAYVMLSLSYLLLGHYSYTFVLETFIAFYFFPKYGHLFYLTTPLFTMLYYLLINSYVGYQEIQLLLLGICLFFFTALLKRISKLAMGWNVLITFFTRTLLSVSLFLIYGESDSPISDLLLVLIGSIVITMLLWWFYVLRRKEDAQMQRVIEQGQTDALTGIYNFQKLGMDLHDHQQADRSFALAMIDLDYFKQLNDTYGHTAGNESLQNFVHLMDTSFSSILRKEDYSIYRFGGEEFCVIFPDYSKQEAFEHLSFFKHVYNKHRRTLKEESQSLTFSAGIASSIDHGSDGMKTIKFADEALYRAKNNGRDQICIYEE